jgi:hypothetical protein
VGASSADNILALGVRKRGCANGGPSIPILDGIPICTWGLRGILGAFCKFLQIGLGGVENPPRETKYKRNSKPFAQQS